MDHEKLIELVRNHKLLYDLSDRMYGDTKKKEVAWRHIGKQLNVREQDCKKAWFLLRDSFRRAVKKTRESTSGQDSVLTKKWKYEDDMSFLLPFFKDRPTISTVRCENENEFDEDIKTIENPPDEEARFISPEPIPSVSTIEYTQSQPTQTSSPLRKRKKLTMQSKPSETASSTLVKYILEKVEKPVDDIEQFFNSISTTVKQFPPKDRAIAKAKVFRVISEMELEIVSRNA